MCYFIPKYLINKINTAIIDHLGIVLTSPLLYRKLYIIGYFIQNKFEIFIFTILNFIHLLVVILIENILDITISPTFVNNETNTFRLPEIVWIYTFTVLHVPQSISYYHLLHHDKFVVKSGEFSFKVKTWVNQFNIKKLFGY